MEYTSLGIRNLGIHFLALLPIIFLVKYSAVETDLKELTLELEAGRREETYLGSSPTLYQHGLPPLLLEDRAMPPSSKLSGPAMRFIKVGWL